jgi:arginyl-tRNA synthetase
MSSSAIDPRFVLGQLLEAAIREAYGQEAAAMDPMIHRSAHADYQADAAMALAKHLKQRPRDVANAIVDRLTIGDVIAQAAVSGPGFINLTLRSEYLSHALGAMLRDERQGVPRVAVPDRIVVDYSGPNAAKEMHVGHLRSTIIGDAIARVLEFQGHTVLRQNHIGDWGTPFGMLIEHLQDERGPGGESEAGVRELSAFYRTARAKFDADPAFADRARGRVVLLQGGDVETLALWRRLIDQSVQYFSAVYSKLGVTLRPEHVAGESTYNAELADVVGELERVGLARVSEGAICAFPPGFTGREGDPVPLIVRKHDGGYSYATTDLTALRHRVRALRAQRLIYVIGSPQSQHMAMVFAVGRLAGWVGDDVRLEHVAFGSVLGADKKMLKTRAGQSVSLVALLDEAVDRARQVVGDKMPDLDAAAQARVAEAVGIGAVKYADLANDRIKDYVFDWDRMLAFEGNTAPYLMYAHARIRSILRKAETSGDAAAMQIVAPQERALALELMQFPSVVSKVAETLQPHRLCGYLHELAMAFTSFYESCPVLKADVTSRPSRLALCALTASVLARGLDLLGIAAPERM